MVRMGDTMLLSNSLFAQMLFHQTDFMPLSVDYKEKFASSGRFPGGFLRREGRASGLRNPCFTSCWPRFASFVPRWFSRWNFRYSNTFLSRRHRYAWCIGRFWLLQLHWQFRMYLSMVLSPKYAWHVSMVNLLSTLTFRTTGICRHGNHGGCHARQHQWW